MTFEMTGGGRMRMWEDAGRAVFHCERPMSRDGLYKVWLQGDGGEALLGTLVPEGDRLALRRAVWPGELQRFGCWPVRGAECRMTYPFGGRDEWRWEECPQNLVDAETARFGEWQRMLYYKEKNGFSLASPLQKDCPLPLAHLFCMAQPRQLRGQQWLVWTFDREGKPRWPEAGNEKNQ